MNNVASNSKKNNSSGGSAKWIALGITLALLLSASGYLYFENESIKEINGQQKTEIDALHKLKREMSDEIKTMNEELEKQKGKNEELDQLLSKAEEEMIVKEKKIKQLITDNASLGRLRKEVKELKELNETYLKRIKELEELIAELRNKNESLAADNQLLTNRLNDLEGKNSTLQKKVDMASVLKLENIIVLGEKKGKNGKYAKTKAKKAERFWVTYELAENKVAEKGEKIIYIALTDPSGKLIENTESGTFKNLEDNVQMPYTQKVAVSYNNQKQRNSFAIDLNSHPVGKGTYTFQFYCDGYHSGVKKITLK